jgi:hypothetical protein
VYCIIVLACFGAGPKLGEYPKLSFLGSLPPPPSSSSSIAESEANRLAFLASFSAISPGLIFEAEAAAEVGVE